jgi:hypothetical protein
MRQGGNGPAAGRRRGAKLEEKHSTWRRRRGRAADLGDQPDWDAVGFYGTLKAVKPTPRGRRWKVAGYDPEAG